MGMNGIKAFSIVALVLASMVTPLSAMAAGDRVVVFAAASLKNAMDDVAAAYKRVRDADLRVSYAGSSTLARQIEQGAPAAAAKRRARSTGDSPGRPLAAPGGAMAKSTSDV